MIFNSNVDSFTQTYLLPKVVDTITLGNILTLRLLSDSKKWKGKKLDKPFQFQTPNTGGSFSGLDVFSVNQADTKRRLTAELRAEYQSIVIAGIERDMQQSDPNAAIDIVTEAMEEGANALADRVAGKFYGAGTGNNNKDFYGLQYIIDDGTNAPTYLGQSRTTYPTLKGNLFNVTGNLNSISPLQTADSTARKGTDRVNLIISNETKFSEYERILQATVLSNNPVNGYAQATRTGVVQNKAALAGEIGFDALYFRGSPWVADQKCPDKIVYLINDKFLDWFGLDSTDPRFKAVKIGGNTEIEGIYSQGSEEKSIGLNWSGLKPSLNQYGEIGQFILQGNLVSFNPNRHAVINYTV